MKHIEIAGKQYELEYTVNSACEVEERSGKNITDLLNREFSGIRWLLWGGLISRQPRMTVREVGNLIGEHISAGGDLVEISTQCLEGMKEAGFFGKAAAGAIPSETPAQ
jgi:hypothetical protein